MTAKADGNEEEYQQWKYRIYLVGFHDPVGFVKRENPTVLRAVEMIKHLVPEAYVSEHPIFREDEDGPVEEQGSREFEDGSMRSAAGEKTGMSIEDVVGKGDKSDNSEAEISEAKKAIPVAFETMAPLVVEIEDMIEDSASVTSVATYQFSPAWIEKEALALLETIRQTDPTEKIASRNKVLLAGYGFGGIVIKQAIIIANTTPEYYNLALNISSLVFLATPHRSKNRLAWEEVLLNMIKATKISCRGRLSHILSDLVDSVFQLSHVYYKFAAKYPTTNFIEGKGLGIDEPVVGELGKFNNNLEKVVSWPDEDLSSLLSCAVDDLEKLESLRIQFTPAHLSNQEMPEHLNETSQAAIDDTYFEALQTLSSSRWILYENRTLEKPADFSDLHEIYGLLLDSIAWKDVLKNGSIQVTGPAGSGKSALVKLITQEIRQSSSVVILDNFLNSSEGTPPTLYDVYVSSIHQIISQRPSLFRPVQKLMVEILRQKIWTVENLGILLAAILHHSRAVDFLIIIYDFEDWPNEIRSWWSETLGSLMKSCVPAFTFLTSSHRPINDLTSSKPHELDLKKEYGRYKNDFIRAKTNNLLDHAYGSVTFGKGLSEILKKKIISRAKSFQGSFTAINTYLALLFQSFTLNTLEAIMCNIKLSPQTEEQLYEQEISRLRDKPPIVRSWISSAVSWMLWSVRTLRIEELAAAVAVDLDDLSMAKIQAMVSMDMERDLRSQLGPVVAIENRYARIASASARGLLSRNDMRKSLDLHSDSSLTTRCLGYITLILRDKKPETWNKCLSQVSWKHQTLASRDPALEFLYYACRFWPTHFLLVKKPDSNLKKTVVEFLLAPEVGERWFQLYLLCSSQCCDPLIGDQEASGPATFVPECELTVPEKAGLVTVNAMIDSPDEDADARQSAVRIASFVGLASIIPEILGGFVCAKEPKIINVRRGYSERAIAFWNTGSRYYLDCAISNDDDSEVKALLVSEPARITKYFPLHKAVLAGCLKTAQTIFNLVENPAQVDQEGRTPLHLAAIGGSTNMIRFLLGKDVSNAQPRRKDIPNMIDLQDMNLQTPLIIASRMGNIEATRLLIESRSNLAIYDGAGKTALHYAVLNCPEVIADFAAQDSVHIHDDVGCTPLHIAARSSNVETTLILVSAFCHLATVINAQDGQMKTPLHYAAGNGHKEVVEFLLQYEASPEIRAAAAELAATRGHLATVKVFIAAAKEKIGEKIGERLLKAASGAGQLLVVLYLLHNKLASPDGEELPGPRPLSLAASKGHNEVVHILLRYKAAVDIEDADRQTALHHVAKSGSCYIVDVLLDHQANVNAADIHRNTPLHIAARAGRVNVVELLLKRDANCEACSRTRETALHLAVASPKAVKALLEFKANPDAANLFRQTPLHIATRGKWHESAEHLLISGADIDIQDDDGKPSLYHAINQNDLKMVKLFFEKRPDYKDEDRMHSTLNWAVKCSALDVLKFMLNLSPESVNKRYKKGCTALHKAARFASLEVLIFLLESRAELDSLNHLKKTPLHVAASAGQVQNMRELIRRGAKVDQADGAGKSSLHIAAEGKNVEVVDVLLEARATVNKQDKHQKTPLYLAAFLGRAEIVERLLSKEANVTLVDHAGWSPLHVAANHLQITKMLIASGAEVNLQKKDLWTPLHLATFWDSTAVAKFLLKNGAEPNQANFNGETALHLALDSNDLEIVAAILRYGADVNKPNNQGWTPLHTAIIRCAVNVVQLLLCKEPDFKIKLKDGRSCLSLAVGSDKHETLEMLLSEGRSLASDAVWGFGDMAAAYWKAIECDFPNSLEVLVNKEGRLLDEVSDKGFTGIETCLRSRKKLGDEEAVAIRLLKLGADPNPLKRRQADQESCFELGIISQRTLKVEFIVACLELVPKDLFSTPCGLGFKELRIAIELNNWEDFETLSKTDSAMTDRDGWSLDHFIHQSAGRVPTQLRDMPPLKPTKTPTGLVLPPMWLPLDRDIEGHLEDAPSRLEFSFAFNEFPECLRADFPFFPRDLGPIYFEITISHTEPTAKPDSFPPTVALGFCGEFCDQRQAHTGWNLWSVGYHGDDGCIFEESGRRKYSTEHKFGPGNTIGCGIDYASKEYFFTLDGNVVASYACDVIFRKLYPAVSHRHGVCQVKVNFGETDFVWQATDMEPPEL